MQSPTTLDTRIAGQTDSPLNPEKVEYKCSLLQFKPQSESSKDGVFVVGLPRTDKQSQTILSAADWIERIAQRHSELSKLFLDGFSKEDFEVLARNLREITKQ